MASSNTGTRETLRGQRPFRRVGAAMPKFILRHFSQKLRHAGNRKDARVWLGSRILLAFLLGTILLLLYLIMFDPIATAESIALSASLFLGGFIFVAAISYLQLYYQIADRTTTVEKVLPDFLLLTVSNLRAGMSPFAAFVHAARPEFGAFYDEVHLSAAKTGGKSSLSESLIEISTYFDSHVLQRTVSLFAKGLRSGGHLAKLLSSIAQEARRIQDLRAELTATTKTYVIFLAFILVLVMPFLLAISTHFVSVFLKINAENAQSSAGMADVPNLPVFSGAILISVNDMVIISIAVLTLTSFFVSTLMGIISRGRATYGIKYFPVLASGCILMYLVSKAFIETFLSGFAS
jgi:Flp pilus assembly protein TadB